MKDYKGIGILINNIDIDNFEIFLKDIIFKFGCVINHIEYISNFDNRVRYDYEPFTTSGFHVDIEIIGGENQLITIEKLYKKRIEEIDFLKKCIEL